MPTWSGVQKTDLNPGYIRLTDKLTWTAPSFAVSEHWFLKAGVDPLFESLPWSACPSEAIAKTLSQGLKDNLVNFSYLVILQNVSLEFSGVAGRFLSRNEVSFWSSLSVTFHRYEALQAAERFSKYTTALLHPSNFQNAGEALANWPQVSYLPSLAVFKPTVWIVVVKNQ